jgi:hypothetical protein
MNTTDLISPPRAPGAPTDRETAAEAVALAEVIPGYGPPFLGLAGPWLLFVLALAGPFALVFTLVAVLVAAALLVALAGAILASPYLLVRHLRRHRTVHAAIRAPAVQLVPARSQRARA